MAAAPFRDSHLRLRKTRRAKFGRTLRSGPAWTTPEGSAGPDRDLRSHEPARSAQRPMALSRSPANTSQEAEISAGSPSAPIALTAILIPSPARFANCDPSRWRASSATGRALSSLRSRCMRTARSSVVVPRRRRRTSSASLSVDRAVPERSRILCTLATSRAAEPATRTSNFRPSDASSAPTPMMSASAITPSSPRTIRAEWAS